MSCVIGIDPSIRSTGICIKIDDIYKYVLVVGNPTKKLLAANIPNLEIIKYEKHEQTGLNAIDKERVKALNIKEITDQIENLLIKYKPKHVVMEAIAFAANGTIDQLAGLNYCIRYICIKHSIPTYIVSPTSVKMSFIGNGGATKDMIIDVWKRLDKVEDILKYKCDDLADAFAMVCFPVEDN